MAPGLSLNQTAATVPDLRSSVVGAGQAGAGCRGGAVRPAIDRSGSGPGTALAPASQTRQPSQARAASAERPGHASPRTRTAPPHPHPALRRSRPRCCGEPCRTLPACCSARLLWTRRCGTAAPPTTTSCGCGSGSATGTAWPTCRSGPTWSTLACWASPVTPTPRMRSPHGCWVSAPSCTRPGRCAWPCSPPASTPPGGDGNGCCGCRTAIPGASRRLTTIRNRPCLR